MPSAKSLLTVAVRALGCLILGFAALYYLWSSLATISNFALQYPAFDQYRMYRNYLGLPFPDNAIQLENGHRPILPVLLRLAEIRWLNADQSLQLGFGLACAVLAFGLVAFTAMRESGTSLLQRTSCVLVVALAIFWLGNARMLIHGNELVHVYPIVLLAVVAALCVHAARSSAPTRWMACAGLCAFIATFTFGSGIAVFGVVVVSAVVARIPLRAWWAAGGLCLLAATAYLLGLPGDEGVRHGLAFDPLANATALARWLAAPWVNAWIGLADPPLRDYVQQAAMDSAIGHGLVESAKLFAAPFGASYLMAEALIIGSIGVLAWMAMAIHAWRSGPALSRLQLLGFALASFGMGVAVIVCMARLPYFHADPTQLFGDRYLPWSCLFWLGLGLFVGGKPLRSRLAGVAFALTALLCAIIASPSHQVTAAWAATVHRHNQMSAVAAQLGLWNVDVLPDDVAANHADVAATLGLLKARHLSMFSEPAYQLIESGWSLAEGMASTDAIAGSFVHVRQWVENPAPHSSAAAFEGVLPRLPDLPSDPLLPVVDDSGKLRGMAKLSLIGFGKESLRFSLARKGGFDGYVVDPKPSESLRILVMASREQVLGTIPLIIPEPPTKP